jgi:hypothetical protein
VTDQNVALHIIDADGADMETLIDRLPDAAPLIARIRELGNEPGGDRRHVALVEPRKGRSPKIVLRSVPGDAVDGLRALMDPIGDQP